MRVVSYFSLMALKADWVTSWSANSFLARSYSSFAVSYAILAFLTGSPSCRLSAERVKSTAPLLTLMPSVIGRGMLTTPEMFATTDVSSPCAAMRCPLVDITPLKGTFLTMSVLTPALRAFSVLMTISSEWAEWSSCDSASWPCPS